jgi:hypothetical protein
MQGDFLTPRHDALHQEMELWVRSVFHPIVDHGALTTVAHLVDSRLLELDENCLQRIRSISPVYSLCTRQPLSPPALHRTSSSDFDAALLAAELNTFNGYAVNS